MATTTVTANDLSGLIADNEIVLLDFWAAWCGPCRTFGPVFERASESNPDIVFGKVDTEVERELGAAFQIRSIPTLMVFRDGIIVFSQPGALPPAQLDQVIGAVRELDMDDVREQIRRQSEEADVAR